MYQGLAAVWLSLFIYLFVVWKAKIVEKKERKWVYLLIAAAIGLSILTGLNISLHSVTSLMNNTFGRLSRMVVNI
jgi:hypothetical protein